MYVFDLFLRRVWIVLRGVFDVSVGLYIQITWQMHYGVRVLDLQHRHVFSRFHMKCMPATL
jgi:hypothetical protein